VSMDKTRHELWAKNPRLALLRGYSCIPSR
jgi:hypothetical protein